MIIFSFCFCIIVDVKHLSKHTLETHGETQFYKGSKQYLQRPLHYFQERKSNEDFYYNATLLFISFSVSYTWLMYIEIPFVHFYTHSDNFKRNQF